MRAGPNSATCSGPRTTACSPTTDRATSARLATAAARCRSTDDPRLVLENAYTNYKLVKNDRSWGVHNPRYVGKLLADSIASVSAYLAAHPFEGE